jgi:hypothetical protein
MQLGEIEIVPLGAESLGVRSLCTMVKTPDVTMVLDPSAALAKRYRLEPHPLEYQKLMRVLKRIRTATEDADVLSISHYHFDHVRPGFRNCLYNLSSREERKEMFQGKKVLAKDNRDNINASQRRRAYYFKKDVGDVVEQIDWADSRTFAYGETSLTFSDPLPHGKDGTFLGFVLSLTVRHENSTFLFAPDVQGPTSRSSLDYFIGQDIDLAIVGGPPTYLSKFTETEESSALYSLTRLAMSVPLLVVDHHNMRDLNWESWIRPIRNAAERHGNSLLTMAEGLGEQVEALEAERQQLYQDNPPSEEFLAWCDATTEFKMENLPPL